MTVTTQPLTQQCRDSFTLARHWVTAANVIFLFASAHIREPLERGTPLKKSGGPVIFAARFSLTIWYGTAYRVVCCLAVLFVNPEFTMNTLSFLHSAINQRLLLPVVFALLTTPVLAAGDNSTNSKTPDCPSGQVYDSTKKQCVPEKTSQLSDEDKTRYAYHLAKKGEYQAALDLLNTLKNGDTAEAWNYRGYATRKLGRTDEGIGYYQRSIALDPTYAKVREYLGEAWLAKGRPDLAKEQLKTIATLCGHSCEEYRDLQAAIDGHPES